jgi:hypothetical protein
MTPSSKLSCGNAELAAVEPAQAAPAKASSRPFAPSTSSDALASQGPAAAPYGEKRPGATPAPRAPGRPSQPIAQDVQIWNDGQRS